MSESPHHPGVRSKRERTTDPYTVKKIKIEKELENAYEQEWRQRARIHLEEAVDSDFVKLYQDEIWHRRIELTAEDIFRFNLLYNESMVRSYIEEGIERAHDRYRECGITE